MPYRYFSADVMDNGLNMVRFRRPIYYAVPGIYTSKDKNLRREYLS